jgi:NAD(P)-dependent dehydrogenase (short-subunit alcohol dehydrogenase family)
VGALEESAGPQLVTRRIFSSGRFDTGAPIRWAPAAFINSEHTMTDAKTSALSPLCLVTGANTGIGFEVARGLAQQGARVVLACRDESKGHAACKAIAQEFPRATVELLVIDLGDQRSIRRAAKTFLATHDTLDVLINNAAVGLKERQESVDGIEMTFAVNVLGYFLLTKLLLDAVRTAPAARIINVSSRLAGGLDLSDVEFKRRPYDAMAAYSQSKQADRMLTWALACRLEGSAMTANSMSPGAINTRLLKTFAPSMQGKSPSEGADTVVWLASSAEMAGVTNRFWAERKEVSCQFHSPEQEDALWRLSEEMTAANAK